MARKNKGWQEQRGRHAQAGKGEKASGKGFHGHPEEHAKAAKGKKTKNESLLNKINPLNSNK
jgi:hypothetical protein